jgi:hypothetical protein
MTHFNINFQKYKAKINKLKQTHLKQRSETKGVDAEFNKNS